MISGEKCNGDICVEKYFAGCFKSKIFSQCTKKFREVEMYISGSKYVYSLGNDVTC